MTAPMLTRPGAVVLAAYRPQPELLRAQLESIRAQTLRDFTCLVASDGDDEACSMVEEVVGRDSRFRIVGYDDHVGFYRNIERGLDAVPGDVGWVALSDQDDRWSPEKLARLVPHLDRLSLVSGQARVVRWPKGEVLLPTTARRSLSPLGLVASNQVTGCFSVFRRDLLDIALPFPDADTFTAFHDHWLGICAVTGRGYAVVDEVLQDYVQHDSNVVGELIPPPRRPLLRALRERPAELVRQSRERADLYAGGHSLRQRLKVDGEGRLGWRAQVTEAAVARADDPPTDLVRLAAWLSPTSGVRGLLDAVAAAHRSPDIGYPEYRQIVGGIPYDLFRRLAHRGPRSAAWHEDPARG